MTTFRLFRPAGVGDRWLLIADNALAYVEPDAALETLVTTAGGWADVEACLIDGVWRVVGVSKADDPPHPCAVPRSAT